MADTITIPITIVDQVISVPVTVVTQAITVPISVTTQSILAPVTVVSQTVSAPITEVKNVISAPITIGEMGPPGPQGVPGTVGAVQYIASIAIGGHRLVTLNDVGQVVYADNTIMSHTNKVLGVTTGAVIAGDISTINTGAEIIEPTWAWTLGLPIFLSANGLMTQTEPIVGFSMIVGFPISATKIFIKINRAIIRG